MQHRVGNKGVEHSTRQSGVDGAQKSGGLGVGAQTGGKWPRVKAGSSAEPTPNLKGITIRRVGKPKGDY